MKFPIIIYNIDKQKINRISKLINPCLYFYSYQNFDVEIVEVVYPDKLKTNLRKEPKIYSVINDGGILKTNNGNSFVGNFGYTIYIPNNGTSVTLNLSNGSESINYKFILELDNIIDENNSHYQDIIDNNNLPSYDELLPALTENTNDSDLLKRLLLDFKELVKYKGTKTSISKLLQFIGLPKDTITIFEEYYNSKSDKFTILPNKTSDSKTGNYHILFDNYQETGLNEYNLPVREFIIEDLDAFIESLIYSIDLANRYFTLKEQDISFFGITYSSNYPKFLELTTNMNMLLDNDVCGFRKHLHINAWTHVTEANTNPKIENNLLAVKTLYPSEVKIYQEVLTNTQNKIYLIDDEIFDDVVITQEMIDNVKSIFGVVLHLKIKSPNTYISYSLIDKVNPLIQLKYNEVLVADELYTKIAITNISDYDLEIKIHDGYGTYERYYYELEISVDEQRIDIDVFNSKFVLPTELNTLTTDVDSPNIGQFGNNYYILDNDIVLEDLDSYYSITKTNVRYWLENKLLSIVPSANENNILEDVTDTISLELCEQWVELLAIPFDATKTLMLRIWDSQNSVYVNIPFEDIINYPEYAEIFNCLYVNVIDVYDDKADMTPDYRYLITTTETGINFNQSTFNFVLVDNNDSTIYDSIWELDINTDPNGITMVKIPINYDVPLFFQDNTEPSGTFNPFISPSSNTIIINDIEYPIIKSLIPRLVNIKTDLVGEDLTTLLLDDLIICRLNRDYVVNETNVRWKVLNKFTNETLYESDNHTLLYRITNKTIISIICYFAIENRNYQITKESLFSSFEFHQ